MPGMDAFGEVSGKAVVSARGFTRSGSIDVPAEAPAAVSR